VYVLIIIKLPHQGVCTITIIESKPLHAHKIKPVFESSLPMQACTVKKLQPLLSSLGQARLRHHSW
jgi:hypothetical protein